MAQLSGRKLWDVRKSRHLFNMLGLVKQGKVEEAEEVFRKMLERKIKPDIVVYNALLKGYADQNNIRKAFTTFNNLKKRGLLPTDRTYSSMFSACANTKSNDVLKKVQAEIERRDVTLNPIASNAFLSALVHCGMIQEAFDEYRKMSTVTVETFGALLLACSKSSLEQLESIWQDIYSHELVPTDHCYNTLLQCLRDSSIPDHMMLACDHVTPVPANAKSELRAGYKIPLTLNELKLTLYVSSNGKHRWLNKEDIDQLMAVTKRSKARQLDVRICTLLVSLTVDVHYVLRESKCTLDKPLMRAAIRRLTDLGDIKGAQELRDIGVEFGVVSIADKAKCCFSREQIHEMLQDVKLAGERDETVYRILVKNAIKRIDYRSVQMIIKEMKYAEVSPSSELMDQLESLVATKPDPQKLWRIHEYNGLCGYYKFWKRSMNSETWKEKETEREDNTQLEENTDENYC